MNENKYIDRDKILAYLSEIKEVCLSNFEYDTSDTISNIILGIENGEIPASDVAPIVHGYWKYPKSQDPECSVCGCSYDREEGGYAPITDYCGNCGAKMDRSDGGE